MHFYPEDIKAWKVIEVESVEAKTKTVFESDEHKPLKGIYERLKSLLKTYPPNQRFFSIPRQDLQSQAFWVRSENGQILVRAKYLVWAETCVIDKFYLASENPTDLDL